MTISDYGQFISTFLQSVPNLGAKIQYRSNYLKNNMSVILLVRSCPFLKPVTSTVELSDRSVNTAFKDILTTIQGQTFKHREKYWNSTVSILQEENNYK